MIATNREDALREYKTRKETYLRKMTNENWKKYCDAKANCMRLGIRI